MLKTNEKLHVHLLLLLFLDTHFFPKHGKQNASTRAGKCFRKQHEKVRNVLIIPPLPPLPGKAKSREQFVPVSAGLESKSFFNFANQTNKHTEDTGYLLRTIFPRTVLYTS